MSLGLIRSLFLNKLFAKLLNMYGVRHAIGLAYHLKQMGKLRYTIERSKTYWRKQLMQAKKTGQKNWMMHCELTGQLIGLLLECPHIGLYF